MKTQHPDFPKLLQLIASNEHENIVLAISIAPNIGVDIVKAIHPLLDANLNHLIAFAKFTTAKTNTNHVGTWTIEKLVSYFLQLKEIKLEAISDASIFDGLVFCQNVETLKIDLGTNTLSTDFENFKYFKFKKLILKGHLSWALSNEAIDNLAQQGLEVLELLDSIYSSQANCPEFVVPKELGNISSLRQLHIKHYRLKSLPETLLNLTNLVELSVHTPENLKVPDRMFSLPKLNAVSINDIPDNTFLHLSPSVIFNISNPRFFSFFKLLAWKKNYASHWNPNFSHSGWHFAVVLLQMIHSLVFLFGSDTKSKVGFYFRTSIFLLFLLFFLLLTAPLFLLFFTITNWGRLPELYLQYFNYNKYPIVSSIAHSAHTQPSSIEGIGGEGGAIGCFVGIFLLIVFFLQDSLIPIICRYLFLPLAIILTPVDLVLGGMRKLIAKK